jgi:hypothetical protein
MRWCQPATTDLVQVASVFFRWQSVASIFPIFNSFTKLWGFYKAYSRILHHVWPWICTQKYQPPKNPLHSLSSFDPHKWILKLKNLKQNMCYLSLEALYILGLHDNWCKLFKCLCHPFRTNFLSSNLLFCLMFFRPILGTLWRNKKRMALKKVPWNTKNPNPHH